MIQKGNIENAYELFKSAIHLEVASNVAREALVTEQLKAFVRANKGRLDGKKIAVIQGAIHSSTYHKSKTEMFSIPTKRHFSEKEMRFGAYESLLRKILFKKHPSETDYFRAFLNVYYIAPIISFLYKADPENGRDLLNKISWEVKDREIATMLKDLESGNLTDQQIVSTLAKGCLIL